MKTIFTFFCGLFVLAAFSQSNNRLEVPFEDFDNALVGGFEAPQFQAIHLNEDDKKDLLVFDRKGSVIRTFIYDEAAPSKYSYAPEYEAAFPAIPCWVIVQDYNNDGIDDLFTCGVSDPVTGIEVWTGSRVNGKLEFTVYDHPHGAYNIIYYERNDGYRQLYVGNNGIPGIADVDDDGDIDILAFQPSGGYLYYFKNMSQERGFGGDSLIFTRVDECWGNFYEGGLIPDIVLSDDNSTCALPNSIINSASRHEGITISIFDKDKDGLKDILIGEVSSTNLIFVRNGGTEEDAFATYKEVNFPSNDVPVDMQIFLATFLLDVDQDGTKDLLVAPNSQFGTNINQVSYYQGVDTSFQLVQEDWLVNTILDLGTDSYPSFLDYNGDGLLDLVVGSFGLIGLENGTETRLFLFENIGSADSPKYKLVDDNYLNYLAFSDFDKSFTPSFGDLDGDGDIDLLLGTLSGDMVYSENTAGPGNAVDFSNPVFEYKMLDAQNNTIKVDIADINQDGLGDIIVGGRNSYSLPESIGSLKLFSNIGTTSNPDFSNGNVTLGLGQVNVKDGGTSKVSASPRFYLEGDVPLLFIGNETGRVAVYKVNFDNNEYEEISPNLLGEYLGRRFTMDVADIDNDGFLEMVIGNERGGINFFDTEIQTSGEISHTNDVSVNTELDFFPNPVISVLNLNNEAREIQIYDSLGKLTLTKKGPTRQVDISNLIDGVYYIKADEKSGKFIKSKR